MIKFNHKADSLLDIFDLTDKELDYVTELWGELLKRIVKKEVSVSWAIQRVWVDEHLTEPGKCFLIFSLGRLYTTVKGD